MGQKINPHGLRVGIIRDWDSCWYPDNNPDYNENLNTEYHELKIGNVKDWNSVIKQKIKCQNQKICKKVFIKLHKRMLIA